MSIGRKDACVDSHGTFEAQLPTASASALSVPLRYALSSAAAEPVTGVSEVVVYGGGCSYSAFFSNRFGRDRDEH
jgi:hypothetical protein